MQDNNEQNDFTVINDWSDLKISDYLLRGIFSYGFEKPSPIQQKAIVPIIEGRDVVAQAQSGTGKTAAFTIGALSKVNPELKETQTIILAPTHELTNQIATVCAGIGSSMHGLCVKSFMGGSPVSADQQSCEECMPHVVVGCPGRVFDLIRRRIIRTDNVKILVIDETDEMLSKGFKDQIRDIIQNIAGNFQIAIFSATYSPDVREIIPKFMNNPVNIEVRAEQLTLEGIKQYYVSIDNDSHKFHCLKQLFGIANINSCIIYCNTVMRVEELTRAMRVDGFAVGCIHRNMDKAQRTDAINEFRKGVTRFLISTNITARGIDVQQVSLVINFDLDREAHTYLHRIGRSGRWGRKGTAINFITQRDYYNLRNIENYYRTQIAPLPEGWCG
jgi:translation initiation factor 4A